MLGSTAVIATRGSPMAKMTGGDGGDGYTHDCGNPVFAAGDGGHGIDASPGSMAILSGAFDLQGGLGGHGNPDGAPGLARKGPVSDVDPSRLIPVLTIDSTGEIGSTMSLHLTGRKGERVVFFSRIDFKTVLPNVDGFPLFASPGGHFFMVVPAGALDTSGDLFVSATIPDTQDLIGFHVLMQAITFAPLSPPSLSNPVLEVMRDH